MLHLHLYDCAFHENNFFIHYFMKAANMHLFFYHEKGVKVKNNLMIDIHVFLKHETTIITFCSYPIPSIIPCT